MMTRRELITSVAVVVSGSRLLQAAQAKKSNAKLVTVTLVIDGMT